MPNHARFVLLLTAWTVWLVLPGLGAGPGVGQGVAADEEGVLETTFFPQVYKRFCHIVDRGRPYILTGVVDQDWGATTLTVEKIENCGFSKNGSWSRT